MAGREEVGRSARAGSWVRTSPGSWSNGATTSACYCAGRAPPKAIDDLDVERHYGDVFDDAALRAAMVDVDDVFYCAVDTRAWLRDTAPLFRTNVEGLRHVLDAAVDADLRRFVFTSSIATIGIPDGARPATEDDEFNWADRSGDYIQSRVAGGRPGAALRQGTRTARGRVVRLQHLRARRLAADAPRQADLVGGSGQDAVLHQGLGR